MDTSEHKVATVRTPMLTISLWVQLLDDRPLSLAPPTIQIRRQI